MGEEEDLLPANVELNHIRAVCEDNRQNSEDRVSYNLVYDVQTSLQPDGSIKFINWELELMFAVFSATK